MTFSAETKALYELVLAQKGSNSNQLNANPYTQEGPRVGLNIDSTAY